MSKWSKQRKLQILSILVVVITASIWLFHTTSITLIARPGETVAQNIHSSLVAHRAWLNDQAIQVVLENDEFPKGDGSFICRNGEIKTYPFRSGGPFNSTLQNECDQTVTIELWWFDRFPLLNIPLDYVNPN